MTQSLGPFRLPTDCTYHAYYQPSSPVSNLQNTPTQADQQQRGRLTLVSSKCRYRCTTESATSMSHHPWHFLWTLSFFSQAETYSRWTLLWPSDKHPGLYQVNHGKRPPPSHDPCKTLILLSAGAMLDLMVCSPRP